MVTQLSNSMLERFMQCPLSFYHEYINEDKPEKRNIVDFYSEFGNLIHFFAEQYPRTNFYRHLPIRPEMSLEGKGKLDIGLHTYAKELRERDHGLTIGEMREMYAHFFKMISFPNEDIAKRYYEEGLAFINKLPDMDWSKVIALEQEFSIDLKNGVPPIGGIIDKVERDSKGLIVTDYKTSKPYTKTAIEQKMQLPIYGMACYFLYGEIPYKYQYHFIRYDKIVSVTIPIEKLTEVKNRIKFEYSKMKYFEDNNEYPALYDKFYCNHFCGYAYLCNKFQEIEGVFQDDEEK